MMDNDELFSVDEILAELAVADEDDISMYEDEVDDAAIDEILNSTDAKTDDVKPISADSDAINNSAATQALKSDDIAANTPVEKKSDFKIHIDDDNKAEQKESSEKSESAKSEEKSDGADEFDDEQASDDKPYGQDDYAEDLSDDLECETDYTDLPDEEIPILLTQRRKSVKIGCVFTTIFAAAAVILELLNHFKAALPPFASAVTSSSIYCAVNLILLALGAVAAYKPLICGIEAFFRMRANRYSMSAIAVIGCLIQNMVLAVMPQDGLNEGNIHLYAPVALVALAFTCFGYKIQTDNAIVSLKVASSKYDKYGVMIMKDSISAPFTKGVVYDVPVLAYKKETSGVDNFAGRAFSRDAVDSASRALAPFVVIAAVMLGSAVGYSMNSLGIGMTVFAAILAVSAPFTYALGSALTMKKTVKRLVKLGGTIVGGGGTEFYSYTNSIVLSARSLFPQDTVVLHGIKTFGGARIDDAILSAASVACACDSVLRDMFMQIISGKKDMLSHAEGLQYEDGCGVSAWVNKKRVLIGTREHMLNYGVDAPSKDYEEKYSDGKNELVYLAVSGELAAVFVVELLADASVAHAMRMLEYKDIAVVIDTSDAIITQERIEKIFGIDRRSVKILPSRLKQEHERAQSYVSKIESGIIVNKTAASFAAAVCEAKKLKSSFMLQTVLHLASALAGFLLIAAFAFIRDFSQLTTFMLMVYQAMWGLICVIAAKLK